MNCEKPSLPDGLNRGNRRLSLKMTKTTMIEWGSGMLETRMTWTPNNTNLPFETNHVWGTIFQDSIISYPTQTTSEQLLHAMRCSPLSINSVVIQYVPAQRHGYRHGPPSPSISPMVSSSKSSSEMTCAGRGGGVVYVGCLRWESYTALRSELERTA